MLENIFTSGRRALYVAEIGINHNGDMGLAREMISAAAGAGADAVKFQTFRPELMNSVYTESLLETGSEGGRSTAEIDFFSRFVFSEEQYRELVDLAINLGVVFFTSVFDIPSLEMMERLDVPLYKLASSEVTNHPLVRAVAETGKPAVLSTGISTEWEIGAAVELFRVPGGGELVLMHCVSLYPLDPVAANLGRIPALGERFRCPVGFSDHTPDTLTAPYAAVAGARIFEKHFTIDRIPDCPDKLVSVTPGGFAEMVERVEQALAMTGDGGLDSGPGEAGTARAARRSVFASRDIAAGKTITGDDLVALRPGVGIPPSETGSLIGRKALVDIAKDHLIRKDHID